MVIGAFILLVIRVCFMFQLALSVDYSTFPGALMGAAPSNQNHLVAIVMEFPVSVKVKRNATDHIIGMEGVSPLILEWLSLRYKFNYSIFVPPRQFQHLDYGGPNDPGMISCAVKGDCDIVISFIAPSPSRFPRLEFLHPWLYSLTGFLIPVPELSQNNVDAVVKPFQFGVWVTLIVAAMSVMFIISCFNWFHKRFYRQIIIDDKIIKFPTVNVTQNIYMYVLGTLLSQGGYISNKITPIRLVIGSWCLLTLVVLNVYNGMLFSFMTTTPRAIPLVNSVEDVATNPKILLVLNKGLGGEATFSGAEKGLYKKLGDKMRSYPNSRCNSTKQCVKMVKSLPAQHVYFDLDVSLKATLQEDYRETKQCKMTIAACFSGGGFGWGLAKKHPFREQFNRGTLRLYEIGLITLWKYWFEPNSKPCFYDNNGTGNVKTNKKKLVRLSLANLTGAFVVLAIGCLISLVAFLVEIIVSYCTTNHTVVM